MLPLIAGVAISDFAHPVGGEQLERAAGLDDEDVAVFAREVEASAGGDRRGAEAGAAGLTRCW